MGNATYKNGVKDTNFSKLEADLREKVCVMAIAKMLIEDYKLLKDFKIWHVFAFSLKKRGSLSRVWKSFRIFAVKREKISIVLRNCTLH